MESGRWDEDTLLVKHWREKVKKAAELFMFSKVGTEIPYPFTDELIYLYDFGCKKGGFVRHGNSPVSRGDRNADMDCVDAHSGAELAKWKIKIKVLDTFYDNSEYYGRNYNPCDANGVPFQNDPDVTAREN